MPRDELETRFVEALLAEPLLEPDEAVVVGVSGGADSVALLCLLEALNETGSWALRLHVAHLNHQLRGQAADEDAKYVEDFCRQRRVPCTCASADVRGRAEAERISVEQAARQCRFEFLERVALRQDADKIALAHHADDNAETILHRIIRGTGLRGLAGILPSRMLRPDSTIRIIRPLLRFRRAEIEKYLHNRNIQFRRDASNDTVIYTRNRIRLAVMPLLREHFNPQVEEALTRLAEQARGVNDYLAETGERMLEALVVEQDERQIVLHCPSLTKRPRVIQTQLIRQALLRLGVSEGEMTYVHLNRVADLAADISGSKTLDLPASLRVSRRYTRLVLERLDDSPLDDPSVDEVRLRLEGATFLPVCRMEIILDTFAASESTIAEHIHKRQNQSDQACYEEWLDAEHVHPPLLARSRRPGDRFYPLGMAGVKKLSDFLIDQKVDFDLRDRTAVVCDQLGPIWVVPFRIDDRVRLTRGTHRILRLRARPIQE
ncbi:MAG: tRNA lysidine(34) synthetase TilS [Phycisphaerales bacterium]|nr:tRNA lysidine(34) synthetase TilS [Phycisphaerales bacterium]